MAYATLIAPAPGASTPVIPPLFPPRLIPLPAVLSRDMGSATGEALCGRDDHITSGTIVHRNDRWQGGGMRFLRFRQWLTEMKHVSGGIDAVVYEEVRNHAGTDAAHLFGGWLAILSAWCEHHGIPYEGVPVGTIKRFATGRGNADKGAMVAAMKARGFNPVDDNEADALAILLWAIETRGGLA